MRCQEFGLCPGISPSLGKICFPRCAPSTAAGSTSRRARPPLARRQLPSFSRWAFTACHFGAGWAPFKWSVCAPSSSSRCPSFILGARKVQCLPYVSWTLLLRGLVPDRLFSSPPPQLLCSAKVFLPFVKCEFNNQPELKSGEERSRCKTREMWRWRRSRLLQFLRRAAQSAGWDWDGGPSYFLPNLVRGVSFWQGGGAQPRAGLSFQRIEDTWI